MKQGALGMLEILCVAALLLLFGLTTFTLVSVGADAYSRLLDKRESTSDMRIASSYLSMKVRQCDQSGAAQVRRGETGDILVLTNTDGAGEVLETRIYLYGGRLCEAVAWPEEPFDPELGLEIIPAEVFTVSMRDGGLTITLKRAELVREFSLRLRSEVA